MLQFHADKAHVRVIAFQITWPGVICKLYNQVNKLDTDSLVLPFLCLCGPREGFLPKPGLMNKCVQSFPPCRAITPPQKKTQMSFDCECPQTIKRKPTLKD